ncbi:MAG: DNRLRE domain-containing protein [Bacteroidota bacterium]
MKKPDFFLILIMMFGSISHVSSQSMILLPTADVYVDQQNPTTNYNGQGLILSKEVISTVTYHRNICLKFDIPPTTGSVWGAIITISPDISFLNNLLGKVRVYALNGPWTETGITYTSAVSLQGALLDSVIPTASYLTVYLSSSIVENWATNPSTNFGIMLSCESAFPPAISHYMDREDPDITLCPQLNIMSDMTGPPLTPLAILGPDTVCAGDYVTFTVFPGLDFSVFYNWTFPANWQFNSSLANIVYGYTGTTSGQICVSVSNGNGASALFCKTIIVKPFSPFPGCISGPDSLCAGDTATFVLNPTTADSSWNWEMSNGLSLVSGQGTNSIVVALAPNLSGGYIKVGIKGYCISDTTSAIYYVYPMGMPYQPGFTSVQNTVWPNSIVTFSVYAMGATSYIWTLPPDATIVGSDTSSTVVIHVGVQSGQVCVQGKNKCSFGPTLCGVLNVTTAIGEPIPEAGFSVIAQERGLMKINNGINSISQVSVFNVTGAEVIHDLEIMPGTVKSIYLGRGFFLVRVASASGNKTYKLVL